MGNSHKMGEKYILKKVYFIFKWNISKNCLPKGNKRKITKTVVREIPLLSFSRVMVKVSSNTWGIVRNKQKAQVLRKLGLSA